MIKSYLRAVFYPLLYFGGIFASFRTAFKDARTGLFILIVLIPQPNVWHKLQQYPLGKDFLDVLFVAIVVGIFVQKLNGLASQQKMCIAWLLGVTYLSCWYSSFRFGLPIPISTNSAMFVEFKNYAQMILLYFLAFHVLDREDDRRAVLLVIGMVILLISIRSYRNFGAGPSFRYDKRLGGPFEAVGLGANHYGAFVAHYGSIILGLALCETRLRDRLLYISSCVFSLYPLFFTYSRGAYAATLVVISMFGVFRNKILLIGVVVVVVAWTTILPPSVVDRIQMTEQESGSLDSSAGHRVKLWETAFGLFKENPVFGIGYSGFGRSVAEGELTDTHNFYIRTLCEQGIIGIVILLWLLLRALKSGFDLWRTGITSFEKGLGLGFLGCVVAVMVTNIFGDRWSYFVLGGYFWIVWGVVDRTLLEIRSASI